MTMKTLRAITLSLLAAGWLALACAQGGVRPEVGTPLKQAADMLKAGKAKEALGKVRDAENVPNRTPAEQITIDRMKAAAAQRAGDMGTAIQALEAVYGKTGGAEQGSIAEQIASAFAQQKNNAKATEWLNKAIAAGNSSASVRQLQSYLQSASGDYAAVGRDAAAAVAAAEQAGRKPDEGELLRLADAQQRTGNNNAYVATLEKLLLNYPKKDYWNAFLGRLPRKSGFSDRYSLDVMRLRLASGTLSKTEDFMEMAQLSLQAALPYEAVRIIDQGYKAGALGTGAEAARHQRLKELAVKKQEEQKASIATQATDPAATADDLVKLGYAYVTMGEADKGTALIEKAIAKGGLKHPEDARLRLGMAQLQSTKGKAVASQTLRSIKGNDGASDIARLWLVVGAA